LLNYASLRLSNSAIGVTPGPETTGSSSNAALI
jgi:hypothetical protein